jgi:hypothetical protein
MDEREILARAMPPPMDVAVDGHFAGKLSAALTYELRGWTALSVCALGLAGALAILLVVARVPGVDRVLPFLGQGFFERDLVAHVTFAFVVWYLGVQGALTVLVSARLVPEAGLPWLDAAVGRIGLYGATISFPVMIIPVLMGRGTASPNNYIPVISDPVYVAGLVLLATSLALPVLRLLLRLVRERRVEPATFGIACAGLIYLLALLCAAAAWMTRPAGFTFEGTADYVMWGVGHVLQFANTALLLSCLFLLSRVTLGETPLSARLFKLMLLLLVAGAAIGPLLYLGYQGGDPAQRAAFTALYRYALPVPAVVIGVSVAALLVRRVRDLWDGCPELRGLAAALILFGVGGVIGFFESSVDTRTPAHYHAELIAVTLIFMAVYFAVFLPLMGRRTERRRLRTFMYLTLGGGQLLHSSGLYVAGALGVARKVAGSAQGLDTVQKTVAMQTMGVGGVVAVTGGIVFVVLAGSLILARRPASVTAGNLSSARV